MLNSITIEESYLKCIEMVKKAYWPYNDEDNAALSEILLLEERNIESKLHPINIQDESTDEILMVIKNKLTEYIQNKCKKGCYQIFDSHPPLYKPVPFMDMFHIYISKRKWEQPYYKPSENIENILNLAPQKSIDIASVKNFSLNYGNYCHFINVVASLSHLIHFFSDDNNSSWFNDHFAKIKNAWKHIKYNKIADVRKFRLMLAGFYHDIGKTVVDHRHAMEGYMILSSYQSGALMDFTVLSNQYKSQELNDTYHLDREDLLFIADLVYYHDVFGTLSTGENGYVRLINMIERIERYCRKEDKISEVEDVEVFVNDNRLDNLKKIGKQIIFDLWLLNLADLMVSVNDKYVEQKQWTIKKLGFNQQFIKDIIDPPKNSKELSAIKKGNDLLHDLMITFNLFDIYVNDQYQLELKPFKSSVLKFAYYHNVARIRRLVKNSLFPIVYESQQNYNKDKDGVGISNDISDFFITILDISKYAIDKTIDTAIRSSSDYADFFNRLSWVGILDYSLGFFRKLAKVAFNTIKNQIISLADNPNDFATLSKLIHTGWINENKETFNNEINHWCEANARYFVDNYIHIIIQTINHLLFRDSFSENIINFEFEDAEKRLTPDKINRILFFEGPARSTKSMTLILETVFIY